MKPRPVQPPERGDPLRFAYQPGTDEARMVNGTVTVVDRFGVTVRGDQGGRYWLPLFDADMALLLPPEAGAITKV